MKNTVDLKILGNPLLLVILLFIVVIVVLSIVNYFTLQNTKNIIENFYQMESTIESFKTKNKPSINDSSSITKDLQFEDVDSSHIIKK